MADGTSARAVLVVDDDRDLRELVAEALADPATREAAIQEFRRALARTRTVVPSLEFAARVNKEIGQGSGDAGAEGRVTIVFMSNVDPGSWRPRAP